MANLETLELTINANAQSASAGLTSLINSLSSLSAKVTEVFSKMTQLNAEIRRLGGNSNIAQMPNIGATTGASRASRGSGSSGIKRATGSAYITKSVPVIDTNGKSLGYNIDIYSNGMVKASNSANTFKSSLKEVSTQAKETSSSVTEASESIKSVSKNTSDAAPQTKALGERFKETAGNISKMLPKFQQLSRILRIASTMLIRMGVKALFNGAKEGLQNYYDYAKANSLAYAQNLDSISSTWATLKNQMGASIAPAISAAIPVINSLASAATVAFNAISQLIALLTGQSSWSKATNQVSEFGEAVESAGGGGGGLNETLAAFDELNVIASESSGGGGGAADAVSSMEDMFTEMYEFEGWIRDLVNFVKDNMESLIGIAEAIGVALLSWKLADAFTDTFPFLSKLFGMVATGAVIAITLQVTWMLTNEYLKTGNVGWLIADIFTTAVGATAAAAIAQHFIGGNAGAWTAAITLTLSAVTGLVALIKNTDVSALSAKGIVTAIENALKVGAAGFILLKTVGNATTGVALQGGLGLAVATFGVFVGLKAALDPNIEIFSLDSLKASLLSAAAVGVGAVLLGASWYVAGAAALVTLLAYFAIKALTTKDKVSVDDSLIHLTEAQVKQFVKQKMFTIDPEIMIKVTGDNIKAISARSDDIEATLEKTIGTLNVVKLGLATSDDYSSLKTEIVGSDGTGGLIGQITSWIEEAEQTNQLILKFTPKLVGENGEDQNAWYLNQSEAWGTVKEEVQAMGTELVDLFVEAEKGELVGERMERLKTYLNEITEISNILAGSDVATEAQIDFELKLQDLDSTSLNDVLTEYNNFKSEMATAATEIEQQALANQQRLVNALTTMLKYDPNNAELQQELANAKAGLDTIKDGLKGKIDETYEELVAPGKNLVADWIKNNVSSVSLNYSDIGLSELVESEGLGGALVTLFSQATGVDEANLDVSEFIELGGWDTFTEEFKQKLLSSIELTPSTVKELKSLLKLDITDILKISGWNDLTNEQKMNLLVSLTEAYGAEEVVEATQGSGISITAALNAGMNANASTIKNTAQTLMNSVKAKLTDPSVGSAASQAITRTISGMSSVLADKTVVTTAQVTMNDVRNKLSDPAIQQSARENAAKTMAEMKDAVTAANIGQTGANAGKDFSSSLNDNITAPTTGLNKVKVSMETFIAMQANVVAGFLNGIGDSTVSTINSAVNSLNGMSVKVPVEAEVNTSINATVTITPIIEGATILNAVTSTTQKIGNIAKNIVTGNFKASGGGGNEKARIKNVANAGGAFGIDRGDVFIANEAGAELVGSINGKTSVANQGQIIEGIQRGVAEANSEQNALLRQQNDLLRSILEKDTSVRLNASAALGRVARQSMDMYANMVGGR